MNEPIIRLDRRAAMRWAATVAAALGGGAGFGAITGAAGEKPGYGVDPRLIDAQVPWPRLLRVDQRRAVAALCDYILPAEGEAPSATKIGIHDFIDEWISAPYPVQLADRALILAGLDHMDAHARVLGAKSLADADPAVRTTVIEGLAREADPSFFRRVRTLVIGGYYTTDAGFSDIGYTGNQALEEYPGVSPAVRAALDAASTKLGLPTAY